jgi:uncharacterized iron-regulated membrane protein
MSATDLAPAARADADQIASADGVALGADAPPPKRSWSFAPFLIRLHFYVGILVAPFLVVAAVTGLAFVFTPQLDGIVYDHEFTVDQVGAARRPLAEQVAAAVSAHPDGSVGSVIPPVGPDETTRVEFVVESLGENQHTVFVDPYTNEVRGTLTTWFGETPLMTWFDDLHRNLHLGDLGRHYSELAASWMWVLALGGLVLWLRRQRGRRNMVRATLLPDLAARKGVRRTRSFHASTGVWLLVVMLFLSATGLTWSRYAGANFALMLDSLSAHTPDIATDLPAAGGGHHGTGGTPPAPADPAAVDTVAGTARAAGLSGPIQIFVPEPGAAWTVEQTDRTWPVHWDRVAVDTAGTTITARSDFADWPLLAQLSKLGIAAHMGYLFGLINQLLLAAFALGLLVTIFWGYRMWWQRRPTRADQARPVGTPPARGGWLRLPAWAIAVGVPVVLGLCWAIPYLGVALLAFLAIDLTIGTLRRRRATATAPTSPTPTGTI